MQEEETESVLRFYRYEENEAKSYYREREHAVKLEEKAIGESEVWLVREGAE